MPCKKLPVKFKYTVRKNGVLYVKYKLPNFKNHVWRRCTEETQAAVDEIIEEIKNDRAKALKDAVVPDSCGKFLSEKKAKYFEQLYRKMTLDGLQPVTVRKTHTVAGNALREAQTRNNP
jgi:hypothetical protein